MPFLAKPHFDASLNRLGIFLDRGKGDELARNRLLGITKEASSVDKIDSAAANLFDGISIENPDPDRLKKLINRFFHSNDTILRGIYSYSDDDQPLGKWNVKILKLNVNGHEKICILKFIDEGKTRECLGMRINNILTDAPVPFLAGGYYCLQLGIEGSHLNIAGDFFSNEQRRKYNFELGKADEYSKMQLLADRRGPNIIYMPDGKIQHIDFGASFARYDSLRRFMEQSEPEAYEAGQNAARDMIRFRYSQNSAIVSALLSLIDDDTVKLMNEENIRNDFKVFNPKEIIENYLKSIGIVLS